MESPPSRAAPLIRAAAPFGAIFFALGFWIHSATRFADFRVLHLGGELVSSSRWSEAYDVTAFGAIARSRPEMAASHRELDVFLSTPTFGWAMQPFAALSFDLALVIWLTLGLASLVLATRLLALPPWVALVAVFMPFGVANLHHGQTGFFAIVLAATVHTLCVKDRKGWAGVAAGLVVLKPTLLLGVAIWWLLDWKRWYPAMLAAVPSAGLLMTPGLIVDGLEPWRLFADSTRNRVDVQADVVANQPTLREAAKRLLGGDIGTHLLTQLAIFVLGAASLWLVRRRWFDRTDILSGAAIFVSILVSPHLYVYDSGLVLVPLAVASSWGLRGDRVETLVGIYTVSSLLTIMSLGPFGLLNDWIAPGTIGMAMMFVLWLRTIRDLDASASTDAQRSTPSSVPRVNVISS